MDLKHDNKPKDRYDVLWEQRAQMLKEKAYANLVKLLGHDPKLPK